MSEMENFHICVKLAQKVKRYNNNRGFQIYDTLCIGYSAVNDWHWSDVWQQHLNGRRPASASWIVVSFIGFGLHSKMARLICFFERI